jgi:hypothetical protein
VTGWGLGGTRRAEAGYGEVHHEWRNEMRGEVWTASAEQLNNFAWDLFHRKSATRSLGSFLFLFPCLSCEPRLLM